MILSVLFVTIMMVSTATAVSVTKSQKNTEVNESNKLKSKEKVTAKEELSELVKKISNIIDKKEFTTELDPFFQLFVDIVWILLFPLEIFGLIAAPLAVPLAGIAFAIVSIVLGIPLGFSEASFYLDDPFENILNWIDQNIDIQQIKILFGPIIGALIELLIIPIAIVIGLITYLISGLPVIGICIIWCTSVLFFTLLGEWWLKWLDWLEDPWIQRLQNSIAAI